MRTSFAAVASCGLAAAASLRTVAAIAFPHPDSFFAGGVLADSASSHQLDARAAMMPAVVGLQPRHYHDFARRDVDSAEDCGPDEEFVPYLDTDVPNNDKDDSEDKPDSKPAQTPAPAFSSKAEEVKAEPTPETMPLASSSLVMEPPLPQATPNTNVDSSLKTPENIAEGTYTVEEGCIRYQEVKAGDICLGLVDTNKDTGLTLDQLYCLNPAIDDMCYNLWIGTSYCVGYGGEEPLNTGVSSKI